MAQGNITIEFRVERLGQRGEGFAAFTRARLLKHFRYRAFAEDIVERVRRAHDLPVPAQTPKARRWWLLWLA